MFTLSLGLQRVDIVGILIGWILNVEDDISNLAGLFEAVEESA
jgi:hypothetical protein